MSRTLFGTDGVRGIAGVYPLDDSGVANIARAIGTQFAAVGESIAVGCDTRESSERLVSRICEGLQGVGVNAQFLGVIPTPGLAYVTKEHATFAAGIMVTASHNPYEFNGIKVFDRAGGKLPDEAEEELNRDIIEGVPDRGMGTYSETPELAKTYEDFLVRSGEGLNLTGVRLAFDGANGAAYALGATVFRRLGAEVVTMADTPNGRNINDRCGATDTTALQHLVQRSNSSVGIAVDGDADRIILVDERGRVCDGDHILYTLAVGQGKKSLVATVMSNLGTEQALQSHGIRMERTVVGDRYVLDRMLETGDTLGGEQSGHIILTDRTTTGDALLAAVQVLRVIAASEKTLAEWRDAVTMLPQTLVNFHIEDKSKLSSPEVTDYVQVKTAELGDSGRILVRPSGTEPLARVMVEAPGAEALAAEMAQHIQELVR